MQHQEEGARRAAVRVRHCRKSDLSRPLEGRWPPASNQEIRPVCARGGWWRSRAGMKGNLRASALSLRPVGDPGHLGMWDRVRVHFPAQVAGHPPELLAGSRVADDPSALGTAVGGRERGQSRALSRGAALSLMLPGECVSEGVAHGRACGPLCGRSGSWGGATGRSLGDRVCQV